MNLIMQILRKLDKFSRLLCELLLTLAPDAFFELENAKSRRIEKSFSLYFTAFTPFKSRFLF